jgi:hypothetical protein
MVVSDVLRRPRKAFAILVIACLAALGLAAAVRALDVTMARAQLAR